MSNSLFSTSVSTVENTGSEIIKGSHRSSNLDMSVKDSLIPADDFVKPGIYKDNEGYTQNAWRGSNCPSRFLPAKEVAAYIRRYIKQDVELNACRWSVTTESYSGGQSLTVALMASPFEAFSEEWKIAHSFEVEHGHTQHGDLKDAVSPEVFRLIGKVKAFATSFNYDDSDGMIDYFDRGFYDHYYIGKWNKPYQRVEPKEGNAKSKSLRPCNEVPVAMRNTVLPDVHTEITEKKSPELEIVDYSEKAVAIIGDTIEVKGELRALGGKFNARLRCGAGWIFPKSRETKLREVFGL